MRYFEESFTVNSIKSAYRKWAFKLHPDKGGDAEEFKEMLNQYHEKLRSMDGNRTTYTYGGQRKEKTYEYNYKTEQSILDMYNKILSEAIKHNASITLEIIGTYIWVGNVKNENLKKLLKDNLFRFRRKYEDKKSKSWIPMYNWTNQARSKWHGKKRWDMNEMRTNFGSQMKKETKEN